MTSSTRSRIDGAREAIGTGATDDYLLAPSEHASRYESIAPDLARLLRSSAVQVTAERFERRDSDALAAQAQFWKASRRAGAAVLATGLTAALVLVAGGLAEALGDAARLLLVASSVLGVVAGGLASLWIRRIRDGQLLEAWMTRRAEAEAERLRLFELVTLEDTVEDPLLQLEYFRRYQLDVQRAYYTTRGARHEREARRALSQSSAGMAAGGIASGVAGILAAAFSPAWATLAAVGLVAYALGSAAEHGEATAQDRRNAERYHRTRDHLDHLYTMLDQVRKAVAAGELAALREYVEGVHDQLSLEHRQWLDEIGAAGHAVASLEERLQHYSDGASSSA